MVRREPLEHPHTIEAPGKRIDITHCRGRMCALVIARPLRPAQHVDGAMAYQCEQPWPERPGGVVGVAGMVQREQAFLHAVLEPDDRAETHANIGLHGLRNLRQQGAIGALVSFLGARHPGRPARFVGRPALFVACHVRVARAPDPGGVADCTLS